MSSEDEPSPPLLQCYNKGCAQKYHEPDNHEGACTHHPGVPVFHDALKGWSCCSKRSTDFTDFLHIPGCTTGRHDPVKPPEVEKPVVEPLKAGEEIIVKGHLPPTAKEIHERPSADLPCEKLRVKVFSSLDALLSRLRLQEEEQATAKKPTREEQGSKDEVRIGTKCTQPACNELYLGEESNFTECLHHPGVAIFHDGYKFWSCCQRRTSDFNEFERQEGCTVGEHVWIKPVQNTRSRYDWHQTGSEVIITIYSKGCVPEKCSFEANSTVVNISLFSLNGQIEHNLNFKLYGVVEPKRSSVELMATKVEIKLRKAVPCSWPTLKLQLPPEVSTS